MKDLALLGTAALASGAWPPSVMAADSGAVPLVLPPGVPILCGEDEPEPLRRAVKDLQRDLKKVLGVESPIVSEVAAIQGRAAIVVSCSNPTTAAYRDAEVRGWEAHALLAKGDETAPRVVLQGADVRGAIYAVYEFCDRFLDVPPLWFWASWKAKRRDRLEIPRGLALRFAPAEVRWRAWFPNDTDLWANWSRDPAHLDALYETMLRLKLNCVEGNLTDGGSFSRPYTAAGRIQAARDRGIAFVGHHVTVFGGGYSRWDDYWTKIAKRPAAPERSVSAVDDLEEFWRYHIQTALRDKIECVWFIGFRGNGDQPFWLAFPDAPTDEAERGRIIGDMMHRQVALLKEETGLATPEMRCTMYDEMSDLFAKGLLKPPREPNLIWSFVAARRDHFPAPDLLGFQCPPDQQLGLYFNYQFTSTGSHLAPAEGPWKMEANFRAARERSARPLAFAVVNMGNIREFVTEGAAFAAMMQDFDAYDSDTWLAEHCSRYFGESHAVRAARLYRDYYASWWLQRKADLPDFERQYLFQDLRLGRTGRALLDASRAANRNPLVDGPTEYYRIVPADCGAEDQISALLIGMAESVRRLRDVVAGCEKLREELPSERRRFFDDSLRRDARWSLAAHEWVLACARAADACPDRAAQCMHLKEALANAKAMQAALRDAAHGEFGDWYDGDRIFGVSRAIERTEQVLRELEAAK